MTAQSLINRAFGAITSGGDPTADEAADCLRALNAMLDSWSADRLSIYAITRQVFTLADGIATRTIGTGGNFNVARPPRIEGAGLIDNTSGQAVEYPMEYTRSSARWAEITVKTLASTLPALIYDDDGFPLRTLSFYPVPSGTPQVALYTWTALTSFAAVGTDNTFPPGYEEALYSNLAVRLSADGFGNISPALAALAGDSLSRLKSANIVPVLMHCDLPIGHYFANIYTGS